MTILLTGGTGNTATALARQLKAAAIPFIIASRSTKVPVKDLQDSPVAQLDFQNADTFDKPFQHPVAISSPVKSTYIVVPGGTEPNLVNNFVDHAVQKHNVSRFVLLGGQGAEIDSPYPFSKVWKHLSDLGVEYAVLKPSWFNENLFKSEYLEVIKSENKIYSSTADGKMGWVAAKDIGAVAFALLTSKSKLIGESVPILGPEVLTHDEVAATMSSVLGRKIEHIRLSENERYDFLVKHGMVEFRAKFVAHLEMLISHGIGAEGFPSENVRKLTGGEPQTLKAWVEEHKDRFA